MKTKAYKLAAELGMQEKPVLDWLKANGYPNVRRADMIKADVAQAARQALGRHTRSHRGHGVAMVPPSQARTPTYETPKMVHKDTRTTRSAHLQNGHQEVPTDNLKVSFADLLKEHLPQDNDTSLHSVIAHRSPGDPNETAVDLISPFEETRIYEADVVQALAKNESEKLRDKIKIQEAQIAGLERLLDEAQSLAGQSQSLSSQLERLAQESEGLQQELVSTRERLKEQTAQREALEQTIVDLQRELDDQREMITELDSLQGDHDSVLGDLENARQREVAWRKRALELERAAHAGDDLHGLLKESGLETGRSQLRVLQAILQSERLSGHFLKSIRQVDASVVRKLIKEQLRPTCVHPLCQQLVLMAQQTPFRVDDDSECTICKGDSDRRWFVKLASECERAGIRRILVIGGDDQLHGQLRQLSSKTALDFRLMTKDDDANEVRSIGRVEGCDLVVVWSDAEIRAPNSDVYIEAARQQGRPVATVLGSRSEVASFARAVSVVAARNHNLTST